MFQDAADFGVATTSTSILESSEAPATPSSRLQVTWRQATTVVVLVVSLLGSGFRTLNLGGDGTIVLQAFSKGHGK